MIYSNTSGDLMFVSQLATFDNPIDTYRVPILTAKLREPYKPSDLFTDEFKFLEKLNHLYVSFANESIIGMYEHDKTAAWEDNPDLRLKLSNMFYTIIDHSDLTGSNLKEEIGEHFSNIELGVMKRDLFTLVIEEKVFRLVLH